jgi:hypothetical protein
MPTTRQLAHTYYAYVICRTLDSAESRADAWCKLLYFQQHDQLAGIDAVRASSGYTASMRIL